MKNKKTVLLLSILLIQFISFGQLEANQKNFKSAVSTMMFGHKFDDPITREFLEEAEQNGIVKYNLEGSFEQKKYAWKKFILENEALCTKKDKSDGLSEWSQLASSSGPYGLRFSSSSCDDPNKYILQKLQEEIKKSNVLISFIDNDRLNQFQEDFTNKLSNVSITNSAIDILSYCHRISSEQEGLLFLELLEQKGIIKFSRQGQINEKIVAIKTIIWYGVRLRLEIKEEAQLTNLQGSSSKFGLSYQGEKTTNVYNPITENDLWYKDQKNRLKVSEINDKELQKFIKEYSKNKSLYAESSNDNSQEKNCEQAKKKYLEQNPDVAKFGFDAWDHYTSYGKKEGRKWPACPEESNSSVNISQEKNDIKIDDIITHLNSSSENFKKKDYISTINDCNKILELYDNNANSLYPKEITKEADYYNTYFENTVYHNSYELYCWILQLRGTCRFYLNDLGCATVDLEKSIQWNTSIKNYLFKSSDWRISSCFLWNSDCNLLIGLSYLKNTQYKESILYFNKAIEINGLNLKAYNYRGIANSFLYDQTGANFKAAMSDFNFVINKKSNSLVTAHLARGYLNKLLENSVGSCEDVNLAMQISKSNELLITEFDNTLLDFPQFNKAINNCKNTIQSNKVVTPDIIKDPVKSDKIAIPDIIKEPVPITFIKIGNLEWSNNNLDVTQFRNGDPILFVKNESEMVSAAKSKTPAYSIDPFSGTKLYNWYAVNDSRGLAPQGCKLTKYDDFANLFESVKNNKKDLMKIGAWGQIQATDKYGFSAIPNNYFIFNGSSQSARYAGGVQAYFWLSDIEINYLPLKSDKDFDPAHSRQILNSSLDDYWTFDKGTMLAVRCIKGESNFYNGEMANGQPNGFGELFIEEIECYLGTENNRVQLSKGQSYIGLWKNGVPHGEGYIKWYDFSSKSIKKDSSLFYEGKYIGYWQYTNNNIHKCFECGVKNTKCTLKTPEQIKLSKEMTFNSLISWHPSIDKYKCGSYCSSTCELKANQKAELARKQRQQEIESSNNSNTNSSKSTNIEEEKSDTHVFVCDDCSKIQVSKKEPYDKTICPETRWGGKEVMWNDGKHNYHDLGNSGSIQFVCSRCNSSVMLYEEPRHAGACGKSGQNTWGHEWEKE